MRKLLSILLLAFFGLPFASAFAAATADADAGLPVCCRRNGAHHCMQSSSMRASDGQQGTHFSTLVEKCPYCPASLAGIHPDHLTPVRAEAVLALMATHPKSVAQTESKRRIALDRSRQKRGPPSLLSL